MKTITLTAEDFFYWLSQKGSNIKESIWSLLETSCENSSSYEHQFYINNQFEPWTIKLGVLFISSQKLESTGWLSSNENAKKKNSNMLIGTILINLIPKTDSGRVTNKYISTFIITPECGVKIDTPTLSDLNQAWNSLTEIAPTIGLLTRQISAELDNSFKSY